MRRVRLALLLAMLALSQGGCPTDTQPATSAGTRGPASGSIANPCYDPVTSEYYPDCPTAILEQVFAIFSQQQQQARENDIDGDGIPNEDDPDVDGDGQPNGSDNDIDGDGLPNGHDPDADGDGKSGADDPDEDGDGLCDRFDLNDDGDGLFDDEDEDDDGDGDDDDDDDEEDDDDDDDEETNPLEDLLQRQRNGMLTDDDRVRIAKEITSRLDSPGDRDLVLAALQQLGTTSMDPLRDPGLPGVPPEIGAVDAVYDQLSRVITAARRNASIEAGKPIPAPALRMALGEFLPRVQALDELSKSFLLASIRELGLTVHDLNAALGSQRTREFAQALTQSVAANPLSILEDEELDKLTTGAGLLGPTFETTSGGDILDAIRLIDGLVDTPEELADAIRMVRDLGRFGSGFDDAVNAVVDDLIGNIDDGSHDSTDDDFDFDDDSSDA